jgi:hypothetical protein
MKSLERAHRVLEDTRKGPVLDLSPARSEAIIAEALREARAHGAGIVLHVLETITKPDEPTMQKLRQVVRDMLVIDEQTSSD